ncbi:M15 family metallopeptidase [Plantibacter sp. Mn2098]|uniref:M15 family metallopeptidase n=1 Tax=Plantibacter sp. Mn2098 TaxID=3395266 RepID=UPI003BD9420D
MPTTTGRRHRSQDDSPHRTTPRSERRTTVLALIGIVVVGLFGFVACTADGDALARGIGSIATGEASSAQDGPFGDADGVMDDNVLTILDEGHPGIDNLDPALRDAVTTATRAAAADDITLFINSGWRSTAYQQHLLDAAIREYGSEEAARQYVATPDGSAHTRGAAVDIGATDADYWLIQHGSDYGLCQTYANEIWHFELATTPGGSCPDLLPNAG